MPGTAVVVPWRGGCPYRQRAWDWARRRYAWPVVEAEGPDPWSKGAAVMPAIARCSADVVVVADADVWTDGLPDAFAAVASGAAWAIPHTNVHRLTDAATVALIAGADPAALERAERPYQGIAGGGIIVARRATLLQAPLDPRFVGWGQEDESWGVALETLLGPPWRGTSDLLHLYHPPQPRLSRRRGSREGWVLRRRYFQARRDPVRMRELLEEAKRALDPAEYAVHDHAPHCVG